MTNQSLNIPVCSPRTQAWSQAIALGLIALFVIALTVNVGVPPTIIVGVSALAGFFCWRVTNLRYPIDPVKTTVLFLLTTAALHVHMYEEHSELFGPAMSRLFGIAFPDSSFLMIFVFALPTVYYVTAIGLLQRVPIAGFVASHFIFPFITPALEPGNPEPISALIQGTSISGMQNHHVAMTGKYYFPGLYTAILPMIPGIYAVLWLFRNRKADRGKTHSTQTAITTLISGQLP